uniref:PAK4-inhibitor INKA2 n=1 Tax=Hippocampus comes TaxID=109280 RepID=A0A3Q2XA04_HIPCM
MSMKEAGDGLHAQMNSMMGALQELKLLQVQTALDNLNLSARGRRHLEARKETSRLYHAGGRATQHRRWISVDPRWGTLHPSPTYDADDWTSSLMNQSRNRQPLVLGDNVFADLVGNWLDLPEIEPEGVGEEEEKTETTVAEGGGDRPDTPAHPLRLSRSQEICRKFSLTTNIFKKFLRGVRPDRDKLLKERPGWMAPEISEGDLVKRPKKSVPKSSKGSFYLPFWASGQQNRRPPEGRLRKMHPLFDYNTAVWV